MAHSTYVLRYGISANDKKDGFQRLIVFKIVKITSTDKEISNCLVWATKLMVATLAMFQAALILSYNCPDGPKYYVLIPS
jgi:hypothetical protein